MSVDYKALKNELINDPMSIGYEQLIAKGNHQKLFEILNFSEFETTQEVNLEDLAKFFDTNCITVNIDTYLLSDSKKEPDYTYIKSLSNILKGRYSTINLGSPKIMLMIDALFNNGLITSEDLSVIQGFSITKKSRSVILFGNFITIQDVSYVLNNLKVI